MANMMDNMFLEPMEKTSFCIRISQRKFFFFMTNTFYKSIISLRVSVDSSSIARLFFYKVLRN